LWFNTGTLCNLTCRNCYIESSPTNDRLVYLSATEVAEYLDEIEREGLGTEEIGFTGGEPFMNPAFPAMLEEALRRGYRVLVLTNAMRPMMKMAAPLLALNERYLRQLVVRVSLDHYSRSLHELERGPRSWGPAFAGLSWLIDKGFIVHIAGRRFSGEPIPHCGPAMRGCSASIGCRSMRTTLCSSCSSRRWTRPRMSRRSRPRAGTLSGSRPTR
jgi:MoaA/NifB/PqqE/SkfB family radical SAM enzyme